MEECSEFLLHVTVVAAALLTTVNAPKTVDFRTNEILKGCKIASYHDKSDPVYTTAKIVLCAAEEADEFKELIISILKNIIIIDDSPSLEFLSDSWFDSFGSIAEYRYEFWPLIGIFDEIFIIFDSPHRNLDKNLLMKLNSA